MFTNWFDSENQNVWRILIYKAFMLLLSTLLLGSCASSSSCKNQNNSPLSLSHSSSIKWDFKPFFKSYTFIFVKLRLSCNLSVSLKMVLENAFIVALRLVITSNYKPLCSHISLD